MKISTFIICLISCLSLVACATHDEPRRSSHKIHSSVRDSANYGRVSDIELVSVESRSSGSGAVLGAVIGGVLGHQFGKGTGRDVATGAGAIGGAVAGHKLAKRSETDVYRVTVTLENGDRERFDYEDIGDLQVGDRVKVKNGEIDPL